MSQPAKAAQGTPMRADTRSAVLARFMARDRLRPTEALPWLAGIGLYVLMPDMIPLGAHIIVMILFALSLDLIAGYAGIIILGHAAFYGAGGYAAGILAVSGWTEPLSGLALGAGVAAVLGFAAGLLMLRTSGLGLLMLSLSLLLLLQQAANHFSSWTGGADGLQGMELAPLFGRFHFGLDGSVMYLYAAGVLFVCWALMRVLVGTPFGRSLVGIRENATRMTAIGVAVRRRELLAFTVSATFAGVAGALAAQVDQFVSLNALSFELSGMVLVVLVLGGIGRLYGAFVGAPVYFIAQDFLAKDDPVFWLFWLGLLLIAVVLFARGGVLGLVDGLVARLSRLFVRARS